MSLPPSLQDERVLRQKLVDYAVHYGSGCRDCADEDGICPLTGIGCGERRKAATFVVDALIYGAAHGYCPAALSPAQADAEVERKYVERAAAILAPHSSDAPGTPTRDALVVLNAALFPQARRPLDALPQPSTAASSAHLSGCTALAAGDQFCDCPAQADAASLPLVDERRQGLGVTDPASAQYARDHVEPLLALLRDYATDWAKRAASVDPVHQAIGVIEALRDILTATKPSGQVERSCTCHPDDRPSGECRQKFAASECQQAAALSPQSQPAAQSESHTA